MTLTETQSAPRPNGWRIAMWGVLLALLSLPALMMQLSGEWAWTAIDFILAAILLGFLGLGGELAMRIGRPGPARIGIALAALTAFLTLWSNAAVGIIGAEGEAVNIWFTASTLLGILASALVRLRANAMRWIAAALSLVPSIAGLQAEATMPGHGVEWGILAVLTLMWVVASLCFARAAKP
ncbi:hypothetical protein [Paraurantiacibacter namhicola]|uniref:Uncharacterized protein n=1 Tax=Paraurantiacibacter namhicola TaxID=645517 RepID=A0A1C7DBS2_9SPHN|nr:hypothetical protein [Paraurantiacibacter namhicola]ANU08832.1 hypothetical protein A6F65_02554 [Paraurantiacibacter namhicola]